MLLVGSPLACGRANVGDEPCSAAHHCHVEGGTPTCDDGYTWENPNDTSNLTCVTVETCTCDVSAGCDTGCSCDASCSSCQAESDAELCARKQKNCGSYMAADNCGQVRTVDCGSCSGSETCAGGGVENVCGDPLAHCSDHVKDSGESDIDCGGACSPCGLGLRCGSQNDCAVGTCDANTCMDGTWSSIPDMPTARGHLAAVWGPDGRLYALGGISPNSGGALDSVEAYDPDFNAWTTLAPMPTARYDLAAVVGSDDRIYAIGGQYDNSGVPSVDGPSLVVEAYTPASNSWDAVASLHEGRYGVAAVAAGDGLIYAFGGFSVNPAETLNTVETYSITDDSWTTAGTVMTTARSFHTAALGLDGKIYAFGGNNDSGDPCAASEVHAPGTAGWFTLPPMPTPREALGAATATNGRIYVFGGNNYSLTGTHTSGHTVEAYDPTTQDWSQAAILPTGRYEHAVAAGPDGRIYVVGGMATGVVIATPLASVEVFEPSP